MSLKEIESVADALPVAQQRELLAHLQAKLAAATPLPIEREQWLQELDELRARTKPVGPSVLETLGEIRADRF